jgi:superfamily II DNA or RNA helicase
MRLEYRWIDYHCFVPDAKYVYYYEILDDLSRIDILDIEHKILIKNKTNRNHNMSTEYFYCKNYCDFHQSIISILDEMKVKYNVYNEHTFIKTNYDNKMEPFTFNEIDESKIRNRLQEDYIDSIIEYLQIHKKCFLKAPTGFGKTHIYYKTILRLKATRILFLTPRRQLNIQLVEDKYSSYIKDDNYKIIHFSHLDKQDKERKIERYSKNSRKIIMTCCYQSGNRLLEYIIKYSFVFDLIIFDEAHFITSWAVDSDFLHNDDICNYRIFGSATPTEYIELQPLVYGKIIEKVKVYELINDEILCDIETIVKKLNERKKEYHNLKDLIVDSMIKYKKKKGIVYVNDCKNAENLYKLLKKQTIINVYIYISKDIDVDTDSDTDIKTFEIDKKPCIIICVGMISYGYDNDFIDFICLGDPRQSDIDIRQIIGRGIRWNKKVYSDKLLHLLVPLYKDEFGKCAKNDHLKKYLDYIIGECGKDIIFKSNGEALIGNNKTKRVGDDYDGENIPTEILNEYCTTGYNKYSKFLKFMKSNELYNEISYNKLKEQQSWMTDLGNIQTKYPKFCFRNIHPNNINYYWEKKEALNAIIIAKDVLIKKIGKDNYSELTHDQLIKKYNLIDNKIPNIDIDLYYHVE